MDQLDDVYEKLAAGTGTRPTDPAQVAALLDRVFRTRGSPVPADRLRALRVAEAIGGRDGPDLVETFADDPALDVRRAAFKVGVASKAEGMRLVKDACADTDPELAAEALDLMLLTADRGSTPLARSLLGSPHAAVRARAVALIGHVAGPTVRREVEALAKDPDATVRAAATQALERIDGKLPRRTPGSWWERTGEKPMGDLPVLPSTPAAPSAPTPAAPPAQAAAPAQAAPPAQAAAPPAQAAAPPAAPAPTAPAGPTVEDLLRRLAQAGDAERREVTAAVRSADAGAIALLVEAQRPGGDPVLGRGVCLAAAALGNKNWLTRARSLADDPDPGVRAAAVGAVAALGGPAVLTQVARKLSDPTPVVQLAAIEALASACKRLGVQHMLPNWLREVPANAPADVLAARDQALKGV